MYAFLTNQLNMLNPCNCTKQNLMCCNYVFAVHEGVLKFHVCLTKDSVIIIIFCGVMCGHAIFQGLYARLS